MGQSQLVQRRSLTAALAIVGFVMWIQVAVGEDFPKKDAPSAAVAEAIAHMSKFTVKVASSGQAVEIVAHPLMIYGDAARNNEAGTLWTWGKSGRPVAILELYRNIGNGQPWIHAMTLTSPERIFLEAPNNHRWSPQKSHFVLKDVPNAPDVGRQPAIRLRQMKEISRRFEAHEFWDPNNSRFELRLLVQPVYRYQDESAGVTDAAVFVLAHGTNPEVLLQIEANTREKSSRWQYSLVRLGSAEMHVELDGKEVWTQPRTPGVVGQPTDPYWLFHIPQE